MKNCMYESYIMSSRYAAFKEYIQLRLQNSFN